MDLLHNIGSVCSILSLIIALFISYNIVKIKIRIVKNFEYNQTQQENTVGGDLAGGDIRK